MTVTEQQRIVLLYTLIELGGTATKRAALKHIQDNSYWRMNDSNDVTRDNRPSEKIWRNDISYSRKHLVTLGCIINEKRNEWKISESGRDYFELLAKKVVVLPDADNCLFTERFYDKICRVSYCDEEAEDRRFIQQLAIIGDLAKPKAGELSNAPVAKGTPRITPDGKKHYPRDVAVSQRALCIARHKCEIDESHASFIRRNSAVNYMEPHHLIPMSQSDNFEHSLDRRYLLT